MSTNLAKKAATVRKSDVSTPLKGGALRKFKKQLGASWKLTRAGTQLERKFKFPDFRGALAFTNQIGKAAEKQGHHPDIVLAYGQVQVQLSTHRVKGLTESDFILAAKINALG